MLVHDETLQKIQVLKQWSKEHDLKLFHKVIGDDVVEMEKIHGLVNVIVLHL